MEENEVMSKNPRVGYFPSQRELLEEIELRLTAYEDRSEAEVWSWKAGFAAGARWVAERSKLPEPPGSVRPPETPTN